MLDYADTFVPDPQPVNPYAAPSADLAGPQAHEDASDAELMRTAYLKHEASLKSIGTLYYLSAGVTFLVSLSLTASLSEEPFRGDVTILIFVIGLFILAAFSCVLGRGLRRLASWVKIPVTLLSIVGLMGVPVGTIVNAYILYLVHSKKGKVVLSSEYQDVIQQTPHIKYKTSRVVIGLIVILLLAMAWGVGAVIFVPA